MTFKLSLCLGVAIAAFASPAFAQQAASTAQASAPRQSDEQLPDDIVVNGLYTLPTKIDTATGLGLTLRETPQSVSIVTAQRILDQNLITITDVVRNGVGVSTSQWDDVRNQFFARGFEIKNYQIDGVPAPWTLVGGMGETIADVSIYDRVEIVRGATGLLSGAGDPSASINLVRKHATSQELKGYVNASIGSWNTWRVSGDIGGALTGNGRVRGRVVGRYEEGNSNIVGYSNRKFIVYGTVEADVTDTTLLRAGISHQEGKPKGVAWGSLPTFYTDGSMAIWPRDKTTSASWTYWNTTNQNIFASIQQKIGNEWSVTVNYNRIYNTERTNLLYLYGSSDRTTGLGLSAFPYADHGEARLNSFDGQVKGVIHALGRPHEVVLGALHSVQNRYTDSYAAISPQWTAGNFNTWTVNSYAYPGFSSTPTRDVSLRTKQTGYYGAIRLNIADPLKVIAGGRLASWRQTGYNGGAVNYGNNNVFIPYVGALYDVAPHHRIYASYTKIFQPQSYVDKAGVQIAPLQGNAYEIGLKSGFFEDRLQTSVAVFRINQDNVAQVDGSTLIMVGGIPTQPYKVANGTKSEGFEVEVTGRPLPDWNLNFGYSQFKATDGDGAQINTAQPRNLAKLFTTYKLGRLTFGGGANYTSGTYMTSGSLNFAQKGYTLVNLMGRFDVTDRLQVQANIENLFDKTYYAQIGSFSQYRYGLPRNFTISANYRF